MKDLKLAITEDVFYSLQQKVKEMSEEDKGKLTNQVICSIVQSIKDKEKGLLLSFWK